MRRISNKQAQRLNQAPQCRHHRIWIFRQDIVALLPLDTVRRLGDSLDVSEAVRPVDGYKRLVGRRGRDSGAVARDEIYPLCLNFVA